MANFLIIDDNGIIHSGTEQEMEVAFAAMTIDIEYFETKKAFKKAVEKYKTNWSGDLRLVKVINGF